MCQSDESKDQVICVQNQSICVQNQGICVQSQANCTQNQAISVQNQAICVPNQTICVQNQATHVPNSVQNKQKSFKIQSYPMTRPQTFLTIPNKTFHPTGHERRMDETLQLEMSARGHNSVRIWNEGKFVVLIFPLATYFHFRWHNLHIFTSSKTQNNCVIESETSIEKLLYFFVNS
jgi:hypothetical protein